MAAETIGDRIRRLREAKRLKLREVGMACGVSPQAVSNYEQGFSVPSTARISALAALFDVSERYLLTGITSFDDGKQMQPAQPGGRVVPVYTAADAILAIYSKPLGQVTTHFPCGPRSYVVAIWDDSNAPQFDVGDQIVLDPDLAPAPGDMVLAALGKNPALPIFGRYVRRLHTTGQIETIEHLNELWGSHALADASVGRVVAVMTEHARPRRR